MSTLFILEGGLFHPATQEEIDTVASEQLQQDAEIGRKLINLFNSLKPGDTFSLGFTDEEGDGVDMPQTYWAQLLGHDDIMGDDMPQYRNGIECYANEAASWEAALVDAGLMSNNAAKPSLRQQVAEKLLDAALIGMAVPGQKLDYAEAYAKFGHMAEHLANAEGWCVDDIWAMADVFRDAAKEDEEE